MALAFKYSCSTLSLFSILHSLGLESKDKILVPDYYCESVSCSLALNYSIYTYQVCDCYYPDIAYIRSFSVRTNLKAILVLVPFCLNYDFAHVHSSLKSLGIPIIFDCTHSFPVNTFIDDFSYLGVFSIRKPLCLNEGSLLVIPDWFQLHRPVLSSRISFSIYRNSVSLLKLLRLIFKLSTPYPIYPLLYSSLCNLFRQKSKTNLPIHNFFDSDFSVSLIDFILLDLFRQPFVFRVVLFLALVRSPKSFANNCPDHYYFCDIVEADNVSLASFTFNWPYPIFFNSRRTVYWSRNAQYLYSTSNLLPFI